MTDGPSCESCKFFRNRVIDGELAAQECRRNPPVVMPYIDANQESIPMFLFPQPDLDDWCGEYKAGQ